MNSTDCVQSAYTDSVVIRIHSGNAPSIADIPDGAGGKPAVELKL